MKKIILLSTAVFSMLFFISTTNAKASGYSYGASATKNVITTKKVKLYKIFPGKYEASNKFKYAGYLKKHSKIKVSHYMMSTGGYVIKSKKYPVKHRSFYLVSSINGKWFKNR